MTAPHVPPRAASAGSTRGRPSPVLPRAGLGHQDPGPAAGAAGPGLRTFVLALPAGLELVNANKRYPHPAVRGRVLAEIRKAAWATARHDRIPPLERVQVIVEYQPLRVSRSRDGGNWAPSGKAAIDGIRDAGVLADDDSTRLVLESYRIGQPHPGGRLVLHVIEVP